MKYWVDFSAAVEIEADSKEEAKQKFYAEDTHDYAYVIRVEEKADEN